MNKDRTRSILFNFWTEGVFTKSEVERATGRLIAINRLDVFKSISNSFDGRIMVVFMGSNYVISAQGFNLQKVIRVEITSDTDISGPLSIKAFGDIIPLDGFPGSVVTPWFAGCSERSKIYRQDKSQFTGQLTGGDKQSWNKKTLTP